MLRLKISPEILAFLFCFAYLWLETQCAPRKGSARCPAGCVCHEGNLTVNCRGLDVLPIYLNPGLRLMHVTDSDIRNINSLQSVYQDLIYCDLSNNKIDDLSINIFRRKEELKTLLLTENNVSSLSNHTFTGLKGLETLYLDGNKIKNLTSGVFSPLVSLELLELSRNLISRIETDAFSSLLKLKTLMLRDNKLLFVPSGALGKVHSLLNLDLGNNRFDRPISNDSFSPLSNLYELYLGGCNISDLGPEVFRGLQSLRRLWLGDNKLEKVPSVSLLQTIRLEELNLSQNLFREIPARAFKGLQFLKKIIISGCTELKVIRDHAFMDNILLEYVVLEQNRKLHQIELNAFEGLANVGHVSLRECGFQRFDLRLLSWDELHTLDLSGNPVKCDCKASWLRNLFKTTNISKGLTCSTPQQLVGRQLANLTDEDLQCDNVASRRQVVIGVAVSAAVITALLATVGFRYRMAIAGVLKDRWSGNRKEPQYQKTNSEEESTILHAAQQSLKMTPVTEL